jgi:hypothetical protein
MAKLRDKIQNGLDEARILILGTQVLLGFALRLVFEPAFDGIDRSMQHVSLLALILLYLAAGLEIAPGTYHRIVFLGQDTDELHAYLRITVSVALLPIAFAMGAALVVATHRMLGLPGAWGVGIGITLAALFAWYGVELMAHKEPPMPHTKEEADLSHRIRHVLTEARVVLPGAQALLGFQFLVMMVDGFAKLPASSKWIHLVSLLCVALATILVITPAAYHRIVLLGEETEDFYFLASSLVLAALVPLSLGMTGDLYVVTLKVTHSHAWAIGVAALALAFLYGLWFVFPLARRLWRSPVPQGRLTTA